MNHATLKNQLILVNLKIKELEKDANFLGRHIYKVILFGIVLCLFLAKYGDTGRYSTEGKDRPILQMFEENYLFAFLFCAGIYAAFCVLVHLIWRFQERKELNRWMKRKQILEEKLRKT
jgi:hypothetical protein